MPAPADVPHISCCHVPNTSPLVLTFSLPAALTKLLYPTWIMKGTMASWAFLRTSPLRSSRQDSTGSAQSRSSGGKVLWAGNFSESQPSNCTHRKVSTAMCRHGACLPRKWTEHSSFGTHHTTKWGPQSSRLRSHHLWKQALHLADSILDALQNTASNELNTALLAHITLQNEGLSPHVCVHITCGNKPCIWQTPFWMPCKTQLQMNWTQLFWHTSHYKMRASVLTFAFTSPVETSLAFGRLHSGCLAKHSFKWTEHSSFGTHHTTKWGPQSSRLRSHHLWKQALHLADSILDALQNTASSWKVLSSSLLCFSYLRSQVGGFFTSALKLVFLYPRCQAMVFLTVFSGWVFLRSQTLPLYLRLGFPYLCSEVGVFLPALKLEFSYLCSQIGVFLPLLSNWGSPSWGHPAEPHTPQREPASSAPPTGWGTPPLKLAAEAVDRNRKGRKKSHTHSFGLFASYATLCRIFRSPYLSKACYSSTMQKIQ